MKDQSSFIDFFDSSQIYMDMFSACSDALNYYSNIIGEKNLGSISSVLDFALNNLKKEYSKYSDSIKEGDPDEK